MKKFRFALEPLLRIRKREEDTAYGELAKVVRRMNEQEEKIQLSNRQIDEEVNSFRSDTDKQKYDFDLYRLHNLYIDRLEAQIESAQIEKKNMEPELQAEQEKLREARKKKRIVEILKEKRKAEHDAKVKRVERKQIEDANILGMANTKKRYTDEDKYAAENRPRRDRDDSESDYTETGDHRGEGDIISEYFRKLGQKDPRRKR